MPRDTFDPGIRSALLELNRVRGAGTRSSCQGKTRPDERSSHADFAYVLFRAPLPLSFEAWLVQDLAELARIDPDSVYCRWPERNAELCERLAEAAKRFRHSRPAGREDRVPLAQALRLVEARLRDAHAPVPVWCRGCAVVHETGSGHEDVPLLDPAEPSWLVTFTAFLAADPNPPDPRLREREGEEAVLHRLERGDFGERYRRAWRRFVRERAQELIRRETRLRFAEHRRRGEPLDIWFEDGTVVFRQDD